MAIVAGGGRPSNCSRTVEWWGSRVVTSRSRRRWWERGGSRHGVWAGLMQPGVGTFATAAEGPQRGFRHGSLVRAERGTLIRRHVREFCRQIAQFSRAQATRMRLAARRSPCERLAIASTSRRSGRRGRMAAGKKSLWDKSTISSDTGSRRQHWQQLCERNCALHIPLARLCRSSSSFVHKLAHMLPCHHSMFGIMVTCICSRTRLRAKRDRYGAAGAENIAMLVRRLWWRDSHLSSAMLSRTWAGR